jgi:hypothetical protein
MRRVLLMALPLTLLSTSCTSSRTAGDGADAADAHRVDATTELGRDEAGDVGRASDSGVLDDPLAGEWERRTEPYGGMRVTFRRDERAMQAIVVSPPPVTEARLAAHGRSTPRAAAKAQLECQRSLWKPGEELIAGVRPAGQASYEATILVRDWGFTGTCRHADSRASAHLSITAAGELNVTVVRGKAVTQQWVRVGP